MIVTLSVKPTVTVTSVLVLYTLVFTSLAVPIICKSSVSKSTSAVVAPSASTVKDVATVTSPAAVKRPSASTVKVGIDVCEP